MSAVPAAASAAPTGDRSFSCLIPYAVSAAPLSADAQRSGRATFISDVIGFSFFAPERSLTVPLDQSKPEECAASPLSVLPFGLHIHRHAMATVAPRTERLPRTLGL